MIESGLFGAPCAEVTPLLGREFTERIACFSGFLGAGDVFVYADGNHSLNNGRRNQKADGHPTHTSLQRSRWGGGTLVRDGLCERQKRNTSGW